MGTTPPSSNSRHHRYRWIGWRSRSFCPPPGKNKTHGSHSPLQQCAPSPVLKQVDGRPRPVFEGIGGRPPIPGFEPAPSRRAPGALPPGRLPSEIHWHPGHKTNAPATPSPGALLGHGPGHWSTTPATVTPTPPCIPQGEAQCASGSSWESGGPAPGHQDDTSLPPRKDTAGPPQPHARTADPDSPPSGRAVGGRGAQDPERPTQRTKAPPRGRPAAAPTTPSQVGGNRDRTAPPQARQTGHGTGAGHAEGHGPRGTALPAPSARTTRGARATPPSGERTPRERERTHTKRTRGDHQKGNRTERAERTDHMEWRTSERG